jgi:cellulose biosynthesis protein BcsQ
VEAFKTEANPELAVLGIIYTRHKATNHAREVMEMTRADLNDRIHIFGTPVNESTRFKEASGQGKTVFEIAPDIEGAKAYQEIAQELLNGQR